MTTKNKTIDDEHNEDKLDELTFDQEFFAVTGTAGEMERQTRINEGKEKVYYGEDRQTKIRCNNKRNYSF